MTDMRVNAVISAFLVLAGCDAGRGGAGPPPPAAAKVAQEGDLTTVTLAAEAAARLGIRAVAVESRKVARVRTWGGVVVPPPGSAVVLCAPVTGVLAAPSVGGFPAAGGRVERGRALLDLHPLVSADGRTALAARQVEAEGALRKAEVERAAAKVAAARAERLLRDEAGSQRGVDEARARLALAEAGLRAAQSHRDFLVRAMERAEGGPVPPLAIVSPIDGVVRALHAAPGQSVAAGAALVEVVGQDRVWIRVPVYVGDLASLEVGEEARVGALGAPPGSSARPARPVMGPPSADPDAATVDLYFDLENGDGTLRPGQKVGVTMALKTREASLVVPWASVVHDVHGGTWVYEEVEPRKFVRRRVQVQYVSGADAVLAEGPKAGTRVVTEGVAELFGIEFGIGK